MQAYQDGNGQITLRNRSATLSFRCWFFWNRRLVCIEHWNAR